MIAGVATDTIVLSTRIMKNPMTIAQRAGQGDDVVEEVAPGCCGSLSWVTQPVCRRAPTEAAPVADVSPGLARAVG